MTSPWAQRAATAALCIATLGAAASTWASYREGESARWLVLHHDRNAHFDASLEMATAIRTGDAPRLARALDDARQWPPLHALLSATAMTVTGSATAPVAVWPNVLAFAALALLAFDLARRLCPAAPVAAGLFAWAAVLASPAHQAYATDHMLESLGAALVLLCLDAWMASRRREDTRGVRVLGLALSALLFTKYNYYALTMAGLVAASFARSPADFTHVVRASLDCWRARGSRPMPRGRCATAWSLGAASIGAAAVGAWAMATGGASAELGSLRISMRTASGPWWIAWTLGLAALACAWRPHGRALLAAMTPRARTLLLWHAPAVVLFGLLPARLRHFFDYVSPTHVPAHVASAGGSVARLIGWWNDHYSIHTAVTFIVAAGVVAAIWQRRREPEVRALTGFVACVGLLVWLHPYHQSRFLHGWLPSVWVLAGVGWAGALAAARTAASTRRGARRAVAAAAIWAAVHVPAMGRAGRAQGDEWSPHPTSTRLVVDRLRAWDGDSSDVWWAGRWPIEHVVGWGLLEAPHARLVRPRIVPGDVATSQAFEAWRIRQRPSRLVIVEIAPTSPGYAGGSAPRSAVPDLVEASPSFECIAAESLDALGVRILVYEPVGERR